jgi:hypothetical protein
MHWQWPGDEEYPTSCWMNIEPMIKMIKRIALIAIIIISSMFFSAPGYADERAFPFSPGERLVFQVKWAFIHAGQAVLEVYPEEDVNGFMSQHFVMTANTTPAVDLIYKIRDRIDAYTDVGMTRSILYMKQQEGRKKQTITVNFNWERQEVQYSNLVEKRMPVPIFPGTFDPLSIFYAFRLQELTENQEIERPVSDGNKCVVGRARVIRKEKIQAGKGWYDTYLVEPDLKDIGGVFAKSKDARLQIWVTADHLRIPVMIRSKVIVGHFVAELISFEKGGQKRRE